MFGLFKKNKQSAPEPFDAIARLGELMENYPSHVLDVSFLPMSKPELKAVLKEFWRDATPAQKQAIEVGYIGLANFQNGVGPKPISLAFSDDLTTSKAVAEWDATKDWIRRTSEEKFLLFEEFVTFKQSES
jgi:hypothetical protein